MKVVLKIELQGIKDPVVWRRIAVPGHFSFHQLHEVIQAAMGWRDSHLYRFAESAWGSLIVITSPYDDEGGIDARTVPIANILYTAYNSGFVGTPRKTLTYLYDYGDSWEHIIDVEEFGPENLLTAELLDGAGACPPEDCGGIPGFMDIKESLRTGEDSRIHGEPWTGWLEGTGYPDYDPAVFDVEAAREVVRGMG